MELPTEPNRKPKAIFNPSRDDFSVEYLDDENIPHTYTIKSMQLRSFPTYIADHIVKHLSQKIMWDKGIKTNPEDELKAIRREIENTNL